MRLNDKDFIYALNRTKSNSGVVNIAVVTTLPPATKELRLQVVALLAVPSTSEDVLYICLGDAASTTGYSWSKLVSGLGSGSGLGSVASGTTTDVITHGLSYTPTIDQIIITFAEQGSNNYGRWWVSTIGATTFTVNISANPGASNLDFGWRVVGN